MGELAGWMSGRDEYGVLWRVGELLGVYVEGGDRIGRVRRDGILGFGWSIGSP